MMSNYTVVKLSTTLSESSGHSSGGPVNEALLVAYEVITPVASYVALAFVISLLLLIIISKLVITVDTTKSDLVIYATSSQKLELLVSKQSSNSGAMNNIHAAVALGLMDPPVNYKPPQQPPPGQGKANGFAHASQSNPHVSANSNVVDEAEGEPVRRKKNLKM
jgi:hypothetical protein